jgi:hypothetical protein
MECFLSITSSLYFRTNRILDCVHSNEQHSLFKLAMFVCSIMTNKKQLIAILSLTSILITSGFSMTPDAFSTGSGYSDYHDDDDNSNQIPKGLCKNSGNLISNGCFEKPTVPSNNGKYWNIYDKVSATDLGWDVVWLKDSDEVDPKNPCLTGEPGFSSQGLLELQRGILGGPAEGYQHAELDSDCNGPVNNARSGEKSSVGISQTITTSENNDYKITFAYKARPEQPLSTNGLMVPRWFPLCTLFSNASIDDLAPFFVLNF